MIKYEGTGYGLNPPEDWGYVERTEGGGGFREYVVEPYSFEFSIDGQNYHFIPQSFLEKGRVTYGSQQYYLPSVLKPDFSEKLQGQNVTVDQLGSERFVRDLSKYYGDTQGLLVPEETFKDLFSDINSYDTATYQLDGVLQGPITGMGQLNNQNVYVTGASGRDNPQGWIDWNADKGEAYQHTRWYDPGNKFLRNLGYALIGFGTAGLAGFGPLAAPAAAPTVGTGAGIVGTPGVSTIYPVAAPVAPTVSVIPPTTAVTAGSIGLLDGVTFPTTGLQVPPIDSSQIALIPEGTTLAGQGLQLPTVPAVGAMGGAGGISVGVPGGTVTQAGFIPEGATPALGDPRSFINNPDVLGRPVLPTESAGLSVTDALRAARGLLGAGQNPIAPQGIPRQAGQRQGVDYSGLLSLLQLRAGTPGVSSLTAPATLMPRYQTLLPQNLSLLG